MERDSMADLFRVSSGEGRQAVFNSDRAGTRFLGLDVLRLREGQSWRGVWPDEETLLVILGGTCSVHLGDRRRQAWQGVGQRADPFSGSPAAVYVPRGIGLEVSGETDVEAAIIRAPCGQDLSAALIGPGDVTLISAGTANWRRDVRLVLPPGSTVSQRLIVGETVSPPGNWSGIPPHRHDRTSSAESLLEELYLFKVRPPDLFALQMIYDRDSRVVQVGDGDVVVFRSGYHPTVAAPGATVFYLWALSGPEKEYKVRLDRRFDWVGRAEAAMKEHHSGQMGGSEEE